MGKAPHKKEDLEQMNEEQRHDFDKNIMLDTTDDVSTTSYASQKDIKLGTMGHHWNCHIFLRRVRLYNQH